MRNVSSAFRRALSNDRRHYQIQAIIRLVDDVTVLTVGNDQIWENGLTIEDAVSNDNVFEIGGAIVNQCTLTINNIYGEFDAYDFDGAEVTVSVGLNGLDDGTDEMIQMGVWYVDDTSYDGSIIKLTCLDAMAKFDKPYTAHIVYPATIESIINDCCNRCGVTLASSSYNIPHRDFVVDVAPSGESTTYRQVLSWAAQIAVCFARINSNGELEVKFYDIQALERETESGLDGGRFDSDTPYSSGDNADGGSFAVWETPGIADVDGGTFTEMRNNIVHISSTYSSHIATDDVIITGVTVIEKVTDEDSAESFMPYSQGRSGYVVTIEGNDLIQNTNGLQIATWMADQLIGFQFRKAELSHPDDPAIEAGDVGFFWDYRGNRYPIIISSTTFAPGNAQSTHSSAETPQRSSSAQFSASTKNYVEIRKQMMVQKTGFEAALDTLAEKVDEAGGLYDTEVQQPGGGVLTYYHNKPLLEDSDIRMLFSDVGFTMTADGGQTWYGMTVDGQMIASILQAHGINADWINAGALNIYDSNDNLIFSADKDTRSVYLSGDNVFIGDISATEALQNLSGVMSMTLSNETQGIPCDSNGDYDTFPTVTTDITVYYDGQDVTQSCTYTYTQFNVTGSLSTTGGVVRYTATSLTDDSGYVTFQASYTTGGHTVNSSKRFTLFKVRAGEKGDTGSVLLYFLEPSTNIVKIGEDDAFYPPTIRWDAYTREGNTDIRHTYQGMFKVETTTDGTNWTTVESPETIKTYTTYTPTDTNIVSVRCTLYSVGEFVTTHTGLACDDTYSIVLVDNDDGWFELEDSIDPISGFQQVDMESTAIVKDISSLTQEEVFDILTNYGEVQGLYWVGGQLYVSFNYARGGTLTLGGTNNNNGLLRVVDASNNPIGQWGYEGIELYRGSINLGNGAFRVTNAGVVTSNNYTCNGYFRVDADNAGSMDTYIKIPSFVDGGSKIQELSSYGLVAHVGGSATITAQNSIKIGANLEQGCYGLLIDQLDSNGYHKRIDFDLDGYYYASDYVYIWKNELYLKNSQNSVTRFHVGSKEFTFSVGGSKSFVYDADHNRYRIYGADFVVTNGTKDREVITKDYADRLLYCYETPSPMFGDVGEGVIGDDGYCYVTIDPIFAETISTKQYQVFLQSYGDGVCHVIDRKSAYFIVKGTPNLSFGWEIKAKQADYTQRRLDRSLSGVNTDNAVDYAEEAEKHISQIHNERGLPA